MALKTYYSAEADIPENLKGAYVKKNGRYELDNLSDDHPTIETKKSLETTQSELKATIGEQKQQIARLESGSLPDGKVAVEPEIEKLGLAAKKAELKPADIPTLKTKADELQTKLDSTLTGLVLTDAAEAKGFNHRFKKMFAEKGVKLEKTGEGEKTDFEVVNADGTKQKLDEFLEKDEYFKDFADTFKSEAKPPVRKFAPQFPAGNKPAANKFDAIREQKQAEQQKAFAPNVTVADKFYNRAPAGEQG